MNNTIFNRQPECKSIKLGVIRSYFLVNVTIRRVAGVGEGMFVLYEYFLTAGNTASAKGASLWGFLGANCSPRKCWNLDTWKYYFQ